MVTAPALSVDACGRPGQECVNRLLVLILSLCLGRPYLWSRDQCPIIICYTNILEQLKGKKVKCSRYRPGVAQKVGRGTALLFHDRGARRG